MNFKRCNNAIPQNVPLGFGEYLKTDVVFHPMLWKLMAPISIPNEATPTFQPAMPSNANLPINPGVPVPAHFVECCKFMFFLVSSVLTCRNLN